MYIYTSQIVFFLFTATVASSLHWTSLTLGYLERNASIQILYVLNISSEQILIEDILMATLLL
ncbi:hypothetical protein T12_12252 [Trichinella patagoniensis]|uniref:Uncharacterized protein n=1 Tax=Trichinella patagoniensis TaxID=990121 RepID=A0A0V0ZQ36_9BILA|nr:hypothetical protein T12_12252 [Trichinella patagoniensis]